MAPVSLIFTERVRDFSSLPLPLFLRCSRLLLQLSEGHRNIPPDFVTPRTVVKPMLFCAFLHLASLTLTYIRPANIEQSLLRPTSFQEDLSWHITMLFGPIPFRFLSQKTLELDHSMLPLSALPVRTLLPTSSNTLIGLCSSIF